jgi:hypothetical protein
MAILLTHRLIKKSLNFLPIISLAVSSRLSSNMKKHTKDLKPFKSFLPSTMNLNTELFSTQFFSDSIAKNPNPNHKTLAHQWWLQLAKLIKIKIFWESRKNKNFNSLMFT